MADYLVTDTDLTSVADAIRAKGGTSEPLAWPDGYKAAVEAIQAGGVGNPAAEPNDVNFWDYDGTCLYSYTVEEAMALTELPPLPSHGGLICQGWNWTLDEIKAQGRECDVGATYITDDGATRFYISIPDDTLLEIPLYFEQSISNGVAINWGDGSDIERVDGTAYQENAHHYTEPGNYMISLMPDDNCNIYLGDTVLVKGKGLLGQDAYNIIDRRASMSNILVRCNIGKNVPGLRYGTFCKCMSMREITIPESVVYLYKNQFSNCRSIKWINLNKNIKFTLDEANYFGNMDSIIGVTISPKSEAILSANNCYSLKRAVVNNNVKNLSRYAFKDCHSLRCCYMHDGVDGISLSTFENCYSLCSIHIPAKITEIGNSSFHGCISLRRIKFPQGITSIGPAAFFSCVSMLYYDFSLCTSVPTLANTNAFNGIAHDCEIRVPAALYDEWVAATNWVTYADYIVAV